MLFDGYNLSSVVQCIDGTVIYFKTYPPDNLSKFRTTSPWFLNTDKQVENTRHSRVFLTSLSVLRNQWMNTLECLNLLLKLIDILGGNRD